MHRIFWILITALLISSCGTVQKSRPIVSDNYSKYRGHYKIGSTYKINGKKYTPKQYRYYKETGIASWYGANDGFHGKLTANGDIFNDNTLTAAHKTLPLPSMVKVTNLDNGRSAIIMVNDRGPYAKNRLIDLSRSSAELLGFRKKGTAKVRVQYLPEETRKLLRKLRLKPKHGDRPDGTMLSSSCSANCHVNLVNMKHGYLKRHHVPKQYQNKARLAKKSPSKIAKAKNNSIAAGGGGEYYVILGKALPSKKAENILKTVQHYARTNLERNKSGYRIKMGPMYNAKHAFKVAKKASEVTGISHDILKMK